MIHLLTDAIDGDANLVEIGPNDLLFRRRIYMPELKDKYYISAHLCYYDNYLTMYEIVSFYNRYTKEILFEKIYTQHGQGD